MPSPGHSRATTILVRNLHCPSCVASIDESLSTLNPPPLSTSTSIVSQRVVILHPTSLSTSDIIHALEAVGFEIESVTQNTPESGDIVLAEEDYSGGQSAGSILQRLNSSSAHRKHDAREQGALHIERCDACRAELYGDTASMSTDVMEKADKHLRPAASVKGSLTALNSVVSEKPTSAIARATLSIHGMSCSSCVGKITETLRSKPWIRSADVNLLINSATVVFEDKQRINQILETVRSIGYDAELDECEDIESLKPSTSLSPVDTWQASYAIGGMTCSSCVGAINEALERYAWIKKVEVNLLSNSASILFEGKDHQDQISKIIEDAGYTAKLNDMENAGQPKEREHERSVIIQIDGMHCEHCPSRILDALSIYANNMTVVKRPTTADNKMNIKYLPAMPGFTIRHIIGTIAQIDEAFNVSIYHPPTLEERSQKMHHRQQWRIARRLILSVIAAIPTFVIGVVYMGLVPGDNRVQMYLMEPMWAGKATRSEWALFITATPVYFFAADLFHRRMYAEIKALWGPGSKTPILRRFYRFGSMDMLMSLGISIAYFSSIAVLAINATQSAEDHSMGQKGSFFDAVVFLAMFLLMGRLIEAYSKAKAGDAVGLLGSLRPTEAFLVEPLSNDTSPTRESRLISIDQLENGDVVRISNGASPPYDGVVVEGESQFDESSLTGESALVQKTTGDEVFSGTLNKGAPISIRITRLGGDSMLDQIIAAVREGQIRRAPIERVADLITGYFVPIVTLIAICDWVIWLALGLSGVLPDSWMDNNVGGWSFWSLQFAIAVFVIACPCGIGLAAPTALFVGGGLAAQHGILVKGGGEAFQEASHLDCIIFDKTGTITQGGEPSVTNHEFVSKEAAEELVSAVSKLEESSNHPIARAVVAFCSARTTAAVQPMNMEEISGKGMKGSFRTGNNESPAMEVLVGNEVLMADHGVEVADENVATLDSWKRQAKSVVLVAMRNEIGSSGLTVPLPRMTPWKLYMMMATADPLRPEAQEIVRALHDRGVAVWMLSGDNPITAYAVGKMVGIPEENIIAGVLPDQKAERVQYLQKTLQKPQGTSFFEKRDRTSKRAIVAMVGDGINDSPALTVADVGIAVGSGSDIAISSAEFVLISSGLTSLLTLIDLSRTVFRRIKFNFAWALVYNLIALPVAAGVLYPINSNGTHVRLDPVWASLAMALSSVSVVCSSLLMRSKLPFVGFRSSQDRTRK
ncbi:E1-E2 ATPase-domain-containing protein [Microdochium trichocladiopsis]|uniref:E1-E2 ATPase-domain-containing protein n=1 Tax=Microdochium trichocladiopsis TaxID=1682393 RepID=A0A9P9BMT5_9PEZI|nr:E1-E2 ATPase-domain-containing protein [Microdochium trichocladiopsis]KAH7030556.1 E1-E2 ATPase-domain-containing protein [Microdochium trichocladiopsis]